MFVYVLISREYKVCARKHMGVQVHERGGGGGGGKTAERMRNMKRKRRGK